MIEPIVSCEKEDMLGEPEYRTFWCDNHNQQDLQAMELSRCYIQHNEPESLLENREKGIDKTVYYNFMGYELNGAVWDNKNLLKDIIQKIRASAPFFCGKLNDPPDPDDNASKTRIMGRLNEFLDYEYYVVPSARSVQEFYLALRAFMSSNMGEILQNKLHLDEKKLCRMPSVLNVHELELEYDDDNDCENYKTRVHMALNLMWLKLTTTHHMQTRKEDKLKTFQYTLVEDVLFTLVNVALKLFDCTRKRIVDVTPFHCICHKELWFLIQRYCEIINRRNGSQSFWFYYNEVVQHQLNLDVEEKSLQTEPPRKLSKRARKVQAVKCVAIIWLTLHVAKLLQFDENGQYVEKSSRNISNYSIIEDALRKLLSTKDCDAWLSPTMMLIEFFDEVWLSLDHYANHKSVLIKIISEYICRDLSKMPRAENAKPIENYLHHTTQIVNDAHFIDSNFNTYLHVLGQFLSQYPDFWPSLKGSLIHKLMQPKFTNRSGFENYFKLMFTLCWVTKSPELIEKLQQVIDGQEEPSWEEWNLKMSCILLRLTNGEKCVVSDNFKNSLPHVMLTGKFEHMERLTEIIGECHMLDRDLTLETHRLFYGKFQTKCSETNRDRDLGVENSKSTDYFLLLEAQQFKFICTEYKEQMVLDKWLLNYIKWATNKGCDDVMKMLTIILNNLNQNVTKNANSQWKHVAETYFVPVVNYLGRFYPAKHKGGEIAAKLIQFMPEKTDYLLEGFFETRKDIYFMNTFLIELLTEATRTNTIFSDYQEKLILRVYLQYSILQTDKNSVRNLTTFVKPLRNFNFLHISDESDTPFEDFVKHIGRKISENCNLDELRTEYNYYLEYLPYWCEMYLKLIENNVLDVYTMQIYKNMSLLFFHCSPVLYRTNKYEKSLLILLSKVLLLRPSVIGKPTTNAKYKTHIVKAIENNWIIFARGILRININLDGEMIRLWREMMEHVPRLGYSELEIVVTDDFPEAESEMFIKHISEHFFAKKSSLDILSPIFDMFLIMTRKANTKFPILFKYLFIRMCNHIKWKSKGSEKCKTILMIMARKTQFLPLKDDARVFILKFFKDSLAFETDETFNTFKVLVKLFRNEIIPSLHDMEQYLLEVEKKRNKPFDDNLRRSFHALKLSLKLE